MTRVISIVLLGLTLTGCFEATKRAGGIGPACTALIGPIRYNSTTAKSRRHAGPDLAVDLNRRNQVGRNLRCPAYR